MGREVRRVPLDFDWPMNKTWTGFLNPHFVACREDCGGGYSKAYRWLEKALHDVCYPPDRNVPEGVIALLRGLGTREGFMSSTPQPFDLIYSLCEKAGMPEEWNTCPSCKGDGVDVEAKPAYEAWKQTPVPTGEGWQMWETTSEGSPISPVFDSPEKLARWLSDNNASAFGRQGASYEHWLKMIDGPAWAPSMVMSGGQIMSGVEAVSTIEKAGQ